MTSQDKLFRIDENGYLPQATQIESPNMIQGHPNKLFH